MQWGPLAVRPYVTYAFSYGDGLLRVPGEPVNSSSQTLTPGLLLELGSTWALNTSVSRSSYSSRLLADTYDSNLSLSGNWRLRDWTLSVSQGFTSNAPVVVETGSQNAERTSFTRVAVSFQLGSKSSFDTSVARSNRKANPKTKNAAWTGSDWAGNTASFWANYNASRQVSLSVGTSAGYDDISANPDMTYLQPSGRLRWRPTDKLSVSLSGGFESRKTEGSTGRAMHNPVYDVSLGYAPTLTTSLSLSGSRNVSTAYFNDQTIRGTNWTANIGQRVLQRYFINAGYSEGRSIYSPTTNAIIPARNDKFHSITVGCSTAVLKRGSVSVSYQYSSNASGVSTFGYSSNTISAQLGYRF